MHSIPFMRKLTLKFDSAGGMTIYSANKYKFTDITVVIVVLVVTLATVLI